MNPTCDITRPLTLHPCGGGIAAQLSGPSLDEKSLEGFLVQMTAQAEAEARLAMPQSPAKSAAIPLRSPFDESPGAGDSWLPPTPLPAPPPLPLSPPVEWQQQQEAVKNFIAAESERNQAAVRVQCAVRRRQQFLTSPRSTGFCAIWDCISSSSSSLQLSLRNSDKDF